MRCLLLLLLVSGCANDRSIFVENLETLNGISVPALIQSWGDPVTARSFENGLQFARYTFDDENHQDLICQVDFFFQDEVAVHARWLGDCAWDQARQKPYAHRSGVGGGSGRAHALFPQTQLYQHVMPMFPVARSGGQ